MFSIHRFTAHIQNTEYYINAQNIFYTCINRITCLMKKVALQPFRVCDAITDAWYECVKCTEIVLHYCNVRKLLYGPSDEHDRMKTEMSTECAMCGFHFSQFPPNHQTVMRNMGASVHNPEGSMPKCTGGRIHRSDGRRSENQSIK